MWNALIYVAGSLSAATKGQRTKRMNIALKQATRFKQHWKIPAHCPHVDIIHWNDWDQDRDYLQVLAGDLCIIDHCDAVFLVPGWENSIGTQIEVEYSNMVGTNVFESELTCVQYVKDNFEYEIFSEKALGPLAQDLAEEYTYDI